MLVQETILIGVEKVVLFIHKILEDHFYSFVMESRASKMVASSNIRL